jgi:hypothetical protein
MGKKVLYVVYDETGIDPRKDYDNIGVLTLSDHDRGRWFRLYCEE